MAHASGRWRVWLFVGALLCSCPLAAVAGTGAPIEPSSSVEQPPAQGPSAEGGLGDLSTEAFEADRTRFIVTVYGNGSSEWVFRYEQRLEDPNATTAFDAYAERFDREETDSYDNFRARAASLAESGSDATGREMTAERFQREARTEARPPSGDEFGVVEMSFVWTNFAEPDGDRLVVGDVFVGGLYVGPDQQLRFERGPDVRFESADPDPDSVAGGTLEGSESATWLGERQFTDRRPRIVYLPRGGGDSGTGPGTAAGTGSGSGSGTTPSISPGSLLAVGLLVVVGIAGAVAYRSWSRPESPDAHSDGASDAAAETADRSASGTVGGATVGVGSADTDSAGAEAGGSTPSAPPAVSDDELRSDEELVVELLEDHGGRMKQVDIVDGTEWSKSKVSMLLSDMEEDGLISKLRVGRENIVSLAGHEPDAAASPFDDER